MGSKTVSAQIRTNSTFEEVKIATRETFRNLGGVIQDKPYGFDIEGGNAGVNFGFTASIRAAVSIKKQGEDLYEISSMIVWGPSSLVWICLVAGIFVLGLLWIVAALYLFVDPTQVYYRTITQIERVVNIATNATQRGQENLASAPSSQDATQTLRKLQEMRDAELITSKEYEAKKADILSKM